MADLVSLFVEWLPAMVGVILLFVLLEYMERAISPRAKKAIIGVVLLAAFAGLLYWGFLTE
ncbi:MAG: hypothetical protein HOH66_06495 [Rhodospirillaceae bacterium]|jgi:hypothetical protein|nr:hypothetical protein [Rhodospirillaceae bacterium]MBT6117499.1 hypothetical protein [Rhodospirillaceae bacterium]